MSGEARPILPLDERDEALWMLQHLFPLDGISNIGLAIYLTGHADPAILRKAALSVVGRHAMLRSLVRIHDGRPGRAFREPAEVSAHIDLRTSTRASLDADMRALARRPFDLEHDELTRFTLFELPDAAQVLLVVVHHLAIDALATSALLDDLAAAYESFASAGVAPPAHRSPAPVRQPPEPTSESIGYWRERMASLRPGGMMLDAADYANGRASFAGGRYARALSASVPDAVRRLRRHFRASDNVVLLAAYLALLLRHGAGPDLVVGLPLSLRAGQLNGAVGNYFSTVPLAVRATALTTFADLVDDTFTRFIEAFEHRDLSYEGMIRRFGRPEYDWQTPLFRHLFNFLPVVDDNPAHQGWASSGQQIDTGYSRYDLEFVVGSNAGSYFMQVAYRRDLHDDGFVRRLAGRYEALLAAAADDPECEIGRLPMATPHDKVVGLANRTAATWPGPRTAQGLVSAQIAARPTGLAIVSPAGQVTYQRLGQLARWIHGRLASGAGPGGRPPRTPRGAGGIVAVAAGRGPASAAAILAAWRAGAAYLPLDPAQPADRLRYQLADAGACALVADAATIERIAGGAGPGLVLVPVEEILSAERAGDETAADDDPPEPDQDSIAYVIYTSGSTGKPKGVRVTHGNLANVVRHFGDMMDVGPGTKMLWLTTLGFDISALEFLVPLCRGGTVVVADAQAQARPERLIGLISDFGVDVVQATPTTWRMIIGAGPADLTGRWLLCGGEPLSGTLASRLLATGGRLVNVYGPTETTIWSTAEPVQHEPAGDPAVGRPIANTVIAVVDEFGADCPVDIVGEVVIGGAGVAAGYLNRADLTAERFVSRGRAGRAGRAYRTGDLGRWRADGRLVLHGRIDRQVKVHGGRVELDEVESVLKSHPGVDGAAVLLRQPGQLTEALAAFVVPGADGGDVSAEDLWNHAAGQLPGYAVPSTITLVPALPVGPSGKTDYACLASFASAEQPAPALRGARAGDPADEITAWLVGRWRDLLGNSGISADSNLFLAGGQSLLAISITDEVRRRYEVDLPALAIFQNPTPRSLAAQVKACQAGAAAAIKEGGQTR